MSWNIGYRVAGTNIYLENGLSTYNTIEYNLMISSLSTHKLLPSDITVASYGITNPTNYVRHNRAAGSDYYGFLYEAKE